MPKQTTVTGGGGLKLNVMEWGNPAGPPILFIHGWSQCYLCWEKQIESDLAREFRLVAFDIRGHGKSEAPFGKAVYQDSQLWADDVAAVIRTLALQRPVLAGWSYGGVIITDYLHVHGDTDIAGVNYVGAAVKLGGGGGDTRSWTKDILPKTMSTDLAENIDGMRDFLTLCFHVPPSPEEYERALCWNMVVRSDVRNHLLARTVQNQDVLPSLSIPMLVTQGRDDAIVPPAVADSILSLYPPAQASWYEGVGHAPFMEAPERFNRELAEFIRAANR
jgi:pimeloyl-ACP methyl ester carboxylesterase